MTIANSTTASEMTTTSPSSTLTLSYTSNPIPTLNTTKLTSSSSTTTSTAPSLLPTPPSLYCPTTSSCRHYTPCNLSPGSTNCICASSANGTGFCLDSDISCVGLSTCSRDADCVGGGSKKGATAEGEWVCAVGTCCDSPNVCVRADICGAGGSGGTRVARGLDVDVSVRGLKGRGFGKGLGLGVGWWGGEGGTVGGGFIANAAAAGF
ncbi:hypothetical protein IWZ03DRAFT_375192 [Phyllosticta citriasiana]|uniref:Uncharacterized protein n=1 Tax=Phyllosticta citriasiana TaxID=595635 RepID=A0ABR1KQ02_9PEZI